MALALLLPDLSSSSLASSSYSMEILVEGAGTTYVKIPFKTFPTDTMPSPMSSSPPTVRRWVDG